MSEVPLYVPPSVPPSLSLFSLHLSLSRARSLSVLELEREIGLPAVAGNSSYPPGLLRVTQSFRRVTQFLVILDPC